MKHSISQNRIACTVRNINATAPSVFAQKRASHVAWFGSCELPNSPCGDCDVRPPCCDVTSDSAPPTWRTGATSRFRTAAIPEPGLASASFFRQNTQEPCTFPGTYGIRVKSCFAFNKFNVSVPLIDERGCPANPNVISQFKYDEKKGHADAQLYSMFKFPDSTDVHFQCDIGICKGQCVDSACDGEIQPLAQSRSLANDVYSSNDEGVLMASTSVFVLDPGDAPSNFPRGIAHHGW